MPEAGKGPGTHGDRLAKVIARAGLCSRRDAERWIAAGRVAVNGKTIRTPAFNVMGHEEVTVDGQLIGTRSGTRVWLYHKPVGLVVTEKDPEGRPTIFDRLAELGLPRVLTIGRLDINTEGLLLLTNDGGLKRVLELPATGWLRKYRVRAFGKVSQADLDKLKGGIEIDGIKYGPIDATLERVQGSNSWLLVSLREGKNREVKNVLAALGLQVNRLIRISFGPFQLGDLPVGGVSVIRAKVLRDQLGARLAEQAGVDFESPLPEDAETPAVKRNPNRRVTRTPDGGFAEKAGKKRAGKIIPRRSAEPPAKRAKPEPADRRGVRNMRDQPERAPQKTARVLFEDGREPELFAPRKPKEARAGDRPKTGTGNKRVDQPRGASAKMPRGTSARTPRDGGGKSSRGGKPRQR